MHWYHGLRSHRKRCLPVPVPPDGAVPALPLYRSLLPSSSTTTTVDSVCNLYHKCVVFASRVVPCGLETFLLKPILVMLFLWTPVLFFFLFLFYEPMSGHKHLILIPGSRRCTACTQVSSSCFLPSIHCCLGHFEVDKAPDPPFPQWNDDERKEERIEEILKTLCLPPLLYLMAFPGWALTFPFETNAFFFTPYTLDVRKCTKQDNTV